MQLSNLLLFADNHATFSLALLPLVSMDYLSIHPDHHAYYFLTVPTGLDKRNGVGPKAAVCFMLPFTTGLYQDSHVHC